VQPKNRIFISYAHLDNQDGWVNTLHEKLAPQIEFYLGGKAEIWRDKKLKGNDDFSEEILEQVKQVSLLISVLSPRYIKSDWCRKEAEEFCRAAQQAGGIEVKHKFRFFKIYQLPLDSLHDLPEVFSRGLGYPFYKSLDNTIIRLEPGKYGNEIDIAFNIGVAGLAQQIAETIGILDTAGEERPRGPSVYLGATGWDRESDRKLLQAELSNKDCLVFPREDLSPHEEQCEAEIAKMLGESKLVIQIVGNLPGMVPVGPSQKSVDILQNELAIKQFRERGIRRVVWLPPGTQSANPQHQEFLTALTRNDAVQLGADVVNGDIETFKSAVLAALEKIKAQEAATAASIPTRGNMVYIICDQHDAKATIDLWKLLEGRGFEPRLPLFKGDAGKIRSQNDQLLKDCSATLIYYGAGDCAWYENQLAEIRKAGLPTPVWTYLAQPDTPHKQKLLCSPDAEDIVDGTSALPEADISVLLSNLAHRSTAKGGA
jgi:TIR domain